MKRLLFALMLGIVSIAAAPGDAAAKRLGGGGGAGMQRSLPSQTPAAGAPAKQAPNAPAATPSTPGAAPAAAAQPRRSWLGPIAGIAAGLGLAALMSHFGMGAEFGSILMMVLFAAVAFFAIRFLMRRFGPGSNASPAMAASGGTQFAAPGATTWASGQSSFAPAAPAELPASLPVSSAAPAFAAQPSTAAVLPAGFDAPGFERIAKMIFIRMQAANDVADLNDLRAFTTPEMFAAFKLDLQDRGDKSQQTDVVNVDAQVLDVASEAERQIVSVRFHGLIREEKDAAPASFDEVWHLVRPIDGSHEWAIAGIQQMA